MKPASSSSMSRSLVLMSLAAVAMAASVPVRAEDGISIHIGGFNAVQGSGKAATESRAITGFQAIAVHGSMKLLLRQGGREGVQLTADDNVLALIETKVVDKKGVPTLEIGMKPGTNVRTKTQVVATVDLTTLSALSISGAGDVSGDSLKSQALALSISGSGNVRLKQLTADDVTVRIAGSGDVEFSGRARKLGVTISGSGNVVSRGLETDDVNVRIAGSGDADVNARKTLDVSIAGSGDVVYVGDAVVKSSISGIGKVRKQ